MKNMHHIVNKTIQYLVLLLKKLKNLSWHLGMVWHNHIAKQNLQQLEYRFSKIEENLQKYISFPPFMIWILEGWSPTFWILLFNVYRNLEFFQVEKQMTEDIHSPQFPMKDSLSFLNLFTFECLYAKVTLF